MKRKTTALPLLFNNLKKTTGGSNTAQSLTIPSIKTILYAKMYVSLYVRDFLATITFHFTSCHEKLNAYFIRE